MLALLFAAALVGETLTGPAVALDGNTLLMDGTRVRLFGLYAPEMRAPFGPQARAALDDLIGSREVACLVLDVDSRGRAVASCEVAGVDLSEAVLREGLATTYRIFTYAAGADFELAARLDAAEAAARADGLGIWATAAAETDWWQDFRQIQLWLSAGMAFLGFTLGAWWSHHLTMKREDERRAFEATEEKAKKEDERRALAGELHAELAWVMQDSRSTVDQGMHEKPPTQIGLTTVIRFDRWYNTKLR